VLLGAQASPPARFEYEYLVANAAGGDACAPSTKVHSSSVTSLKGYGVMFETKLIPEARPIAILKKVFVGVFVTLLAIGAVSSYRAYIQFKSLEIQASQVLAVGSKVDVSVVSSGRTTVDVQVELIQNSHAQTLFHATQRQRTRFL